MNTRVLSAKKSLIMGTFSMKSLKYFNLSQRFWLDGKVQAGHLPSSSVPNQLQSLKKTLKIVGAHSKNSMKNYAAKMARVETKA